MIVLLNFRYYEDRVDWVGHVRLKQVTSCEKVLQRLEEVTCCHWLIVVEVIVPWL